MRRPLFQTLMVAMLLAVPVAAAHAADFKPGDVFVGTNTGQYNVFSNQGTLLETIDQGLGSGIMPAEGCAFDRSGVLYTSAFAFGKVVRFLSPAPHTRLAPITTDPHPRSISIARDGSFFVGHSSPTILRFKGSGQSSGSFSTPFPASRLDLSADQRTMFYTEGLSFGPAKIHRFDVAADKALPDFADLGATTGIGDLKLLPPGDGTGGALVTARQEIKRVDGAGKVVKTYDRPGEDAWLALALDPDGKSFWAEAVPGSFYRFDVATGAVDRGPLPSPGGATGFCVAGGPAAALDNAPPTIALRTPADGATFGQGQDVRADFSCADDRLGTGIARCDGTVGRGAPLGTSTPGTKSFKVTAVDRAGNRASVTRTFRVDAPPPPPPTPPAAPPAAPLERIDVTLSADRTAPAPTTTLFRLDVTDVPRGATVTAKCRTKQGRRCRGVRAFVKRNARGTVKLKPFLRHPLRGGTVIEVRVTKPGAIGAVKRLAIRRNKRPTIKSLCLPPGAKAPARC